MFIPRVPPETISSMRFSVGIGLPPSSVEPVHRLPLAGTLQGATK